MPCNGVCKTRRACEFAAQWGMQKRRACAPAAQSSMSVRRACTCAAQWGMQKRHACAHAAQGSMSPRRACTCAAQGSWIAGKRHGLGKQVYAKGDIYEGLWKEDGQDGPGR